jgi:hypothetical protein
MNSRLYYIDGSYIPLTKKTADAVSVMLKEKSSNDVKEAMQQAISSKIKDSNFNAGLYELNPDIVVDIFKKNPLAELFGIKSIAKHYKFSQFRTVAPSGWANQYGDVEQAPLVALNQQTVTSGKIALHVSYDQKRSETDQDRGLGGSMLTIKQIAAREIIKSSINKVNLFGVEGYGVLGSNVHGLLTSSLLPPVVPAVNPGAGTEWINKTGLQICNDIFSAITRITSNANITMDSDSLALLPVVVALPAEQFRRVLIDRVFANGGTNDVKIIDYIKNSYPMVKFIQVDELKSVSFIGGNPDLMLVMLSDVSSFDQASTGTKNAVEFRMSYMFEEMDVDRLHNGGVECHKMVADTFGAVIRRPNLIQRVSGI